MDVVAPMQPRQSRMLLQFLITGITTVFIYAAAASISCAADLPHEAADPVIATYDGGAITLRQLEEFARETPMVQRIPFANRSAEWRRDMCGELAKSIALTSQALSMGLQMQPEYLRAREYFIMEYLAYIVLRDRLTNRMDVSLEAQQREYETNKTDFWVSPTISLRLIRTRSADKIASASAALAEGKDFIETELQFSEVSPRYRGRVIGPFPSAEDRTTIPPPVQVVEAANSLTEGQTTGPITAGDFHYIVKLEKKTEGRQPLLEEVAEKLEDRLRERQSAQLVPALVDQIQKELGVEVDEALFASATPKPNDQLATVGAFKLYRQEFIDLNGRVRGPALPIASLLPTKLKQFVLPYMIAEWARFNHYMDRKETRNAIYYYDLQHLASRVGFLIAEKVMPPPADAELRTMFQKDIDHYRKPGQPEPRFEDYREEVLNALIMQQAPEREERVSQHVLSQLNFKMVTTATSSYLTALEALIAAGDKLPANARLLEIAPARIATDASGATPYVDIGRAPAWRISYAVPEGAVSELTVEGPSPLLQSADQYTSISAYQKLASLWRFDTDSLKRHAVDKALGDFIAKHGNAVRAAATMEFSYSKDDPTSPTDCLIVYSATPSNDFLQDGVMLKYSAFSGEITKRRVGEPEGKCPTCPAPDLPAPQLIDSTTQLTSNTELVKGDY